MNTGIPNPAVLQTMTRTYTEQALTIIERQLRVAAKDSTTASHRGMQFSPKGYIFYGGSRIGKNAATQALAHLLEQENATPKTQPSRTGFEWDRLNAATQAFFYGLCEQIQSATQDADMLNPVRIGKDIPSIGLANGPRLTNLKKAGLFEQGGKGIIRLTEQGRSRFLATA